MDRRESLKSLFVGSLAGGLALKGCAPVDSEVESVAEPAAEEGYGRTEKEKIRDEKIKADSFFQEPELETLAVLCDIILPATADFGSAGDAEVPEFIEFIVKDMPAHQLPLRGGLMWLDNQSNSRFNLEFRSCSPEQQLEMVDDIAYPEEEPSDMAPGIAFFSLVRNLTLTGYYTSKMGIKELGYAGNTPGVWDGVPDEVLKAHGLSYDPQWLERCVDQSKRDELAAWDEDGNLLST
ncbi:MAG: gluconate 2-dehydrogenase subunit 3 family protein [Cyclobacteriaceae bacterium]|nr:gluconate 2-dehydrogenase subunit 3 family protein [Cyclobacteriaceae bacterium]